MQANIFDKTGKKAEKALSLNKDVFAAKVNEPLMAQAVYIYLSNQRQSNAHAKDRSEVSGGGKKPWRQKGTGRARHGSTRSPIWVKGGVAFGPRNTKNYKKTLSKKMIKAAMRSALSKQANDKKINVLEAIDLGKTKYTQSLENLINKIKAEGKVLIVQPNSDSILLKAANNLKNVNVEVVNELNVYKLLNADSIIILKDALDTINKFWANAK